MSDRHSLVVPFLDDSSPYAHGVEFGMLYARMRASSGEDAIEDLFMVGNQDQILLAASRVGWHVQEVADAAPGMAKCEGWFWCKMVRK